MKVSIVVIGDEILLGRVTDTNSGAISRAMDRIGATTVSVCTIGDNAADIRAALDSAMARADVVFTTGGLGPTKDDITKHVLTDIFGGQTIRDDSVTQNIRRVFAGKGLKLNPLTLDQALVPSSAHIIQNTLGTAPIMVFGRGDCTVVSMPGVPTETEGMLPSVVEYIVSTCGRAAGYRHATRMVTGMSESALAAALGPFEDALPDGYKLAYLPDSPIIRLRLDGPADSSDYDLMEKRLDNMLADLPQLTVLSRADESLGRTVINALSTRHMTLSTAESCTGGNIAHTITLEPGSSAVFNGGAVTYANTAKSALLGVPGDALRDHGAVSQPVVTAMAQGACAAFGTDCAVATSGIAGPGGATPDKPVGTVWIAVHTPAGTTAQCHHFPGDRSRVIARATATALIMLLHALNREDI